MILNIDVNVVLCAFRGAERDIHGHSFKCEQSTDPLALGKPRQEGNKTAADAARGCEAGCLGSHGDAVHGRWALLISQDRRHFSELL